MSGGTFTEAYLLSEGRIKAFLSLDFESLPNEQLEKSLGEIGAFR